MAAVLAALVLVHGVVMRGPTKPVCEMATPCSEPAANTVVVFQRGSAVTRVRTDAHGRYSIRLARGTYAVRLGPRQRIGLVVRGRMRADFTVDTGIR